MTRSEDLLSVQQQAGLVSSQNGPGKGRGGGLAVSPSLPILSNPGLDPLWAPASAESRKKWEKGRAAGMLRIVELKGP